LNRNEGSLDCTQPIDNLRNSMMKRIALLVATLFGATSSNALGLEDAEPTSLREMIDAAVEKVQLFAGDSDTPAKPLVALRWANNQRGSEDGMTLLYIHDGRPIATACLYPWAGNLIHDFELLDRGKVVARREGQMQNVWVPKQSEIKWANIPDAPAPDATPTQRLRQLKVLSQQFESTMLGWKRDDTDREALRLLPRPLYRYETKSGPIIDGAVFAFVMGTDPESLLLIEAVQEGGDAKWKYGFARRTSGELEGRHAGEIVWKAARFPVEHDPTQPHYGLGTPIPPTILEALKDE
jgi:hypothetical protein